MFNGANTGFMLLAASLVMLMTPGLAFFYGGLVGRSNTLTIMIQSFASMGITTALWWLVGYSLCFNGGADGIYGNFHLAFLRHVGVHTLYTPSGIPPATKLDVNTASLTELENVPGVGPSIAERIVEARPFKSADDLQRVKGIGAGKRYEKIRPFFN